MRKWHQMKERLFDVWVAELCSNTIPWTERHASSVQETEANKDQEEVSELL